MSRAHTGRAKFSELVLYLAKQSANDAHFDRTKLALLLFYCDFGAHATLGRSLTDARYRKRPLGPIADEEADALRHLEDSAAARIEPQGRWVVPLRPADMEMFSDAERALIEGVLARHMGEPPSLDALDSESAGWRLTKDGEEIPYFSTLLQARGPSAADAARFARSRWR